MRTPDIEPCAPQPRPERKVASAWRRSAIAVGLVGGGFILGAVGFASADGMPWHHGVHHGPKIGLIQHMVRGALDNVGATTAQEDKVHDIIAATYTDLDQGGDKRDALRKQVLDLMSAPTIDRAAVEKLREEKIAAIDAKSKTIVSAMLDVAGQLTPDQRVKLVKQAEDRMTHPGWGGWHHGGTMGEHEHDGAPPDGGPDHAPDDHGDHG